MKFFRRMRYDFIGGSKSSKYLKYAIGEIALVTIGILIALQIDNWKSSNIQREELTNYYEKIAEELSLVTENVRYFQRSVDTLIILNKRSLQILNLKNKDSISLLKGSIGALGTAYRGSFTFPILEEFLEQGSLSKIKNDSLKYGFQAYKIAQNIINQRDSYIYNQYLTSIEPYFYKNINYVNVAHGINKNQLIKGGPETDYSKFLNNLELYNLLSLKLEALNDQKASLNFLESTLKFLQEKIEIHLQENG